MGDRKTVGTIIGEAIVLYRRNFKVFFITTLLAYGTTYLFGHLKSWVTGMLGLNPDSMNALLNPENINQAIAGWGLGSAGLFAVFLFQLGGLGLWFVVFMAVTRLFAIPGETAIVGAYDVMLGITKGRKRSAWEAVERFGKHWKRYLGISAWSSLFVWLWSLLFVIPGLVKRYAYILAPFLILDYPGMTVRQALRKSREITNGYKGRLFGLEFLVALPFGALSVVLGVIFLIFGQLPTYTVISMICSPLALLFFVQPVTYMMITIAYLDIKRAAIEKGLLPQGNEPAALRGTVSQRRMQPGVQTDQHQRRSMVAGEIRQ